MEPRRFCQHRLMFGELLQNWNFLVINDFAILILLYISIIVMNEEIVCQSLSNKSF